MELPKDQEGLIFIETTGFSMWPFLQAGEKLVFKKDSVKNLRIGDILLYRQKDKLVAHRLIRKSRDNQKNLIFVRADSSISTPELLTEQMLLGKAIGILKNGKITSLLRRRYRLINWLIVAFAPAVVIGARAIKTVFLWKK